MRASQPFEQSVHSEAGASLHSEAGLSVGCAAGARLAVEVRLGAKRVLFENLRNVEEMLTGATDHVQGPP